MRARTTILLLALTGGLFFFIHSWEKEKPTTDQIAAIADRVLTLDAAEIDGLKIGRGANRLVLRKQDDGVWYVKRPFKDRASKDVVEKILSLAGEFKVSETLPASELVASFGLDEKNALAITFQRGSTDLGTIQIGKPGPYTDTFYARVTGAPDRPDIYIAATDTGAILNQPAGDYRDRHLSKHTAKDILKITVQQPGGGVIEIARSAAHEDAIWQIEKPIRTRADGNLIDDLLARLVNAGIKTFGEQASAVPPGALKVRLEAKDGSVTKVSVFPKATEDAEVVTAQASDREGEFQIAADVYGLLKFAPNEKRSRSLAVIDPTLLTTLIVKNARGTIPLFQFQDQWYVRRNGQVEEASTRRIMDLVKKLNDEDILEFSSDTPAEADMVRYGLDKPFLELVFGGAKHPSNLEFVAPTEKNSVTLRFGKGSDNRFYGNYSHEPFIYQLSPSIPTDVPTDSVKFKGRNILEINQLAFREITIGGPRRTTTRLNFSIGGPTGYTWTAERAGEDITELLDTERVNTFALHLCVLVCNDWSIGFSDGNKALQKPSLEVRLQIEQFKEDGNGTERKEINLAFAPTEPDRETRFYYGRVDDATDIFLITRETYQELTNSLLDGKKLVEREEAKRKAEQP